MPKAIEIKQYEGGWSGVQKHPRKSPTRWLVVLGFLALPGSVLGECPRSLGAPGVGWIELVSNDLTARIDNALTPIVVCLLLVLCIVTIFDNGSEGTQPGRNESQIPEHGTPTGGNQPHRKRIV